jgi:release factor glutamine methyltransferase
MPEPDDHTLALLATSLLQSGYRFVAPTPATYSRINARPNNSVARDIEGVFGWSRPFKRELLAPDLFALAQRAGALVADGSLWRSRFRFSTLDGLGFLHSAYPTTEADAVFFGPDTYRFGRALSQFLVTQPSRPVRVVDIGCGTGAAAMLAARAWPNAEVTMLDVNLEALRLARINAEVSGLGHIRAAYCDVLNDITGAFDLIVANPPYMADPQKRAYRDGGGSLGADLSLRIVTEAADRLTPGGTLLLYTGAAIVDGANLFLQKAGKLLSDRGLFWHADEIDPDVFGEELQTGPMAVADRIAALWLQATRPDPEKHHA